MRVAFVTTQINLKTGGGSNISPHLKAVAMSQSGHATTMLTLFPEKNAFLTKPPYSVIESPTRFKNWLALQIKIFFTLRRYQNNFDIFSFEGEHFIWGAGCYRLLGGKTPVMMHFNGPIFSMFEHGALYNAIIVPKKSLKTRISNWLRRTFERYIGVHFANSIDTFTSDSPLIKNWHEIFGIKSRIIVFPAFVDLEIYYRDRTERAEDKKIKVLYIGRLVPEKGIDTLLTALKNIEKRNMISVDIVGNGNDRERLIEMSKAYKLDSNVTFHPWSDKNTLRQMYHGADIFVHPARWAEPLGLTVVEAMASGLPVITPEVSGSSWAAGEGGLTFRNGDHNDLRDKIERLIVDERLRQELAQRAETRAKYFDYRSNVKKLESLLAEIAQKK